MSKSIDLERSSTQYLYRADSASFDVDSLTLEIWVKLETNSLGQTFISKNGSLVGGTFAWYFQVKSDNKVEFVYSRDGSNFEVITSTTGLGTGTWYHVACSFNAGTGEEKMYINANNEVTEGATSGGIFDNDLDLTVGAKSAGADSLDGLIDEVRIWNTVRTGTEITDNYNVQLVGNESGLVAYYKFGDNLNDTTANALHLTASGTPAYSTDVPFSQATTSTSTSTTTTSTSTSRTTSSTSKTTSTSRSTSSSTSTSTTSTSSSTTTSTTTTVTSTSTTSSTSTSTTTSTSITTSSTSTTMTTTSTTTTSTSTTSTSTTIDLKFTVQKV